MSNEKREFWKKRLAEVEDGLRHYPKVPEDKPDPRFPLLKLEELYCDHPEYGHLMGALMDLKLTFRFAAHDFNSAGALYNEELHVNKLTGKATEEILGSKIRFLNHMNAHVLRLRSFWDKAMGILILKFCPDKYQKFVNGTRSRKTEFTKLMTGYLAMESIRSIGYLIQTLDDKFRTSEAHKSGTLRNWVIQDWDPNPMNSPFGYLLGLYNASLEFAEQVSDLLLGIENPSVKEKEFVQTQEI